ncbi:MAG: DUF3160 domain-containing protein, partial [Melioribacteraceae bacterium]|nr:DUF3160 domain-containing protein [Melioribacteraceae bacterium]
MKKVYLLFLAFIPLQLIVAQSSFSVDDYQLFLQENANITSQQLFETHNAGEFKASVTSGWNSALYHDSIEIKLKLTNGEKSLIDKNGFVVSERLAKGSFGEQLEEIYHSDLPLYISSDAILHAFHASYDKILKQTELRILIDRITTLLENMNGSFTVLETRYNQDDNLKQMLKDLDVYLTIPRKLLNSSDQPYYNDNINLVDSLLNNIESYQATARPLFSITPRKIDFSQFKPRGHYDDEYYPELAKYFKVMMWFGRIELYLIPPKSFV